MPVQIAAAFAYWRRYAAAHCRLLVLARSIQSRRSSSEPKVITATTWAERDAALRGDAVSIRSTSSSADEPASTGLPFTTAADLPPDLVASKDHAVIRNIITGRLDRTLNRPDGAAERCTPPIIGQSGLPESSQVGPTATALIQAATFWIHTPF